MSGQYWAPILQHLDPESTWLSHASGISHTSPKAQNHYEFFTVGKKFKKTLGHKICWYTIVFCDVLALILNNGTANSRNCITSYEDDNDSSVLFLSLTTINKQEKTAG